jgi:hypothetical protein
LVQVKHLCIYILRLQIIWFNLLHVGMKLLYYERTPPLWYERAPPLWYERTPPLWYERTPPLWYERTPL